MCTKVPKTADFEVDTRGAFLEELEKSLKTFSGSMSSTMNSFRELLLTFDQIAQVYGHVASRFEPEYRTPIVAFRDGMRDMKDKGPFTAFNGDLHAGTISITDPIRVELKRAQKALSDLKSKQKEYDTIRFRLDSIEKEYAKKEKPLESNKSYLKDQVKRDKCKVEYEHMRDNFEHSVQKLTGDTQRIFLQSMNNYLQCTASFCGVLQTSLNSYRTANIDDSARRSTRMEKVAESTTRDSIARRNHNLSNQASAIDYPKEDSIDASDKAADAAAAAAQTASYAVETPNDATEDKAQDGAAHHHHHHSGSNGKRDSEAAQLPAVLSSAPPEEEQN